MSDEHDERLTYLKRTYMSRWDVIRMRSRLVRLMIARGRLHRRMLVIYLVFPFIIHSVVLASMGILVPGGGVGALLSTLYLGTTAFGMSSMQVFSFIAGSTLLQLMMAVVHALNVHLALDGLNKSQKRSENGSRGRASLSTLAKNMIFTGMLVALLNLSLHAIITLITLQSSILGLVVNPNQLVPAVFVVEMALSFFFALWIPEYHVTRYFTQQQVLKKSLMRFKRDIGSILVGNVLVAWLPTILVIMLLFAILFSLQVILAQFFPSGLPLIDLGIDGNAFLIFIFATVALFFGLLDALHASSVISIHLTPEPINLLKLLEDDWMNTEFTIFRHVGSVDEAQSCPTCFSLLIPPFMTRCPYCLETPIRHRKCPQCRRPLKFSPYYCPYCKWEQALSNQVSASQS